MTDVTIIWRDDADKYTFVYTTSLGGYSYYPQDSSEYYSTVCSLMAIYNTMSRKNIKASFALDNPKATGYPIRWAKETTGGTAVDYYNISGTTEAYDFIYETAKRVKNDVEENDEDEVKSRTYVSSLNLQNIVLNEPLKLSISDDACDTDKDGLTDCREVDSAKGLMTYDPDMRPVLPTYEECINCVLLDEDAKTVMEQLRNKMPVSDFNHIKDMHILPLKSDPTKEDSDDDGLLDGRAQVNSKGQKIAPKDFDPLIYNGAEGLWKNHIYSMNNGIVSSKYSNNNIGTDEQSVKAAFEEYINSEIEPKKRPLANMVVYELLKLRNGVNKNEEKLRPKLLIAKELFSEAPELGALILNFVLDENGEIYHSQPDTWQRYWGYNELYDDVFRIASNMNYGRVDFNTGTFQYTLWAWKGDYWNLQSGAEVGLYRYAFDSDDNPHYEAINFEVPMTLSLYNYYSKDNIINVFN